MDIFKYENVNISDIHFNKPEKTGQCYYSSISYQDKPLYIQTDRLRCMSDTTMINNKNPFLEFEVKDFSMYDFFVNLDDRHIKETYAKGEEWFGKDIPLDVIDDMYKRITKPNKKDKKPILKFKLPVSNGKILTKIFDQSKVLMNIQSIKPQSDIISIIHIRGLKFLKQNYICDCYINQMKVIIPREYKYEISKECLIDVNDNIGNEYDIDYKDIKESMDNDILKKLKDQKDEELKLIEQIKLRIKNIDIEIKKL